MIPFWSDKISILYDKNFLFEIIPKKEYNLNRKLNALLRFTVYYSLIVFLMDTKKRYVLTFIVGMAIFTYLLYFKYKESFMNKENNKIMNGSEDMNINELSSECRIPTKDNPFMNPQMSDFGNNVEVKEACTSFDNKGVQKKIDEYFEDGIFKDYADIFNNKNSQRQFFTVPGRDVPNDQGSFAQWLYGSPPTCKEGNQIDCLSFRNGGGQGGRSTSGGVGTP